jgi:hypothetical protein
MVDRFLEHYAQGYESLLSQTPEYKLGPYLSCGMDSNVLY